MAVQTPRFQTNFPTVQMPQDREQDNGMRELAQMAQLFKQFQGLQGGEGETVAPDVATDRDPILDAILTGQGFFQGAPQMLSRFGP